MFAKRYENRLNLQKKSGLYRDPPEFDGREDRFLLLGGKKVLNFASNDYLGLSTTEIAGTQVAENFRKFGSSSSSSRLVSGHYSVINRAEEAYASYFGYEAAVFFPSGYQANLGILSTLFEKGDTIVFDKHIHASSVKGMTLSGAAFYGYNHNSMDHLAKRLESCGHPQVAVLTESLFSMDGDLLNVAGLGRLKEKYGFIAVVDEAHSFGALGPRGKGIAREVADVALGTFGKAFALFGAFVLLPRLFKDYLFNFCSPFIYTTTLPEAHAASALDLLDIVEKSEDRRSHLADMSRLMRRRLREEGFKVSGDAHILALEIGDENKAVRVSRKLLENGIYALPARYPTVPLKQAIIRIGMTALHREEDIRLFVDTVRRICDELESRT
ncbi:aminotransferase class I/II-fold pyridoxal phosphate-dependent enzyme [Desulfoglaeba alkanexedens]|uniref:8-amino-7-oxononanoate synthase n=1 Tax=Desulfoglaeba alkanexedens ALDC TaxID=980445 RepID=A0A4P8L3L4_9BACT|nr:pyridoxal phosphate-dependent aminotransferase family protein [Desulfoglaeba alkanexedens]QCQ22283.1 pyridoxal phosphate-dependent aminotransferase family protein [Desulfoglaeba alkanexedens ALDC]